MTMQSWLLKIENYLKAETLYRKAIALVSADTDQERSLALLYTDVAVAETELEEYVAAESDFRQSIRLEMKYADMKRRMVISSQHYLRLLKKMDRTEDAAKLQAALNELTDKPSGPVFPKSRDNIFGIRQKLERVQAHRVQAKSIPTSIYQIVFLSNMDREYLIHPTLGERTVLDHYEYQTRYKLDAYGNSIPYEVRVPIYRHESYEVSQESDLQFVKQLTDLSRKYPISASAIAIAVAAIKGGGPLLLNWKMVCRPDNQSLR